MSNESHVLCGYRFTMRTPIRPEKASNGRIRQFMPQTRYAEAGAKRLNRHGGGPFCRFSVTEFPRNFGVYALTIEGEAAYVGKTSNLAERWGAERVWDDLARKLTSVPRTNRIESIG